ncbi:MAG: NADH-ubiquinone oxidoreductase-F iron-sulfur binding region domain-containing protein [Methylocystaceae bacterium]
MKIRVGMGSCGIAAGALPVMEALQSEINFRQADIIVEPTGCIGMCYLEPLIDIVTDDQTYTYGRVTAAMANEILAVHLDQNTFCEKYLIATSSKPHPFLEKQVRIALRNCGLINPEAIASYEQQGGYQALTNTVSHLDPQAIINEIKVSGLKGRGGAGFPTWFKWQAAHDNPGDIKYVVCNADEGDPGAFMDRSLLEGDPHSVLEGMAIAGLAIGASQGVIYCRAEYPLAIKRLEIAIKQAEEQGYLGTNILGSGVSFTIRVKQGAGAFVCGEETAMIASLEGERGMPRLKPPFPAEAGYWHKPTNINNVETYANVPWIMSHGSQAFAAFGTEKSKGTKVFALAGKVQCGGLAEVPIGMSLKEVIFGIGGGIKGGRQFKAVQLGGPSGGCIPASLLDTPVDYDTLMATGAIMGSGGMVVMDENTCMVDIARYFLDFTQKESCGKCVQCRIGTKRMLEMLERICEGKGQEGDIERLEELAARIGEGSLCGLGNGAPNPVLTTIKYFRHEYEAHIREHKCPAHQCKSLIQYRIDVEKCTGCTICARKCPVKCISGEKRQPHVIDFSQCIKCGNCYEACPTKFSAVLVD